MGEPVGSKADRAQSADRTDDSLSAQRTDSKGEPVGSKADGADDTKSTE